MAQMFVFFFAIIICFSGLSYFKTIASNVQRRKRVIKLENISSEEDNGKALGKLIEELDFALATIDCNRSIEEIRSYILQNKKAIALFCAIDEVSLCFKNYFSIIGNFVGTEIIAGRNHNQSITKLYPADIVFRKNTDDTLTLLSTFPEDKNHDFFIKDFVTRIKEVLQ